MARYNLSHLDDAALLRAMASLVAQDRVTTAALLAHIAEVDTRGLYLPRGYASMHAYCVEALHLSDDAAYKRITAARAARRFPALFDAVADGRLHLSAVCLIAPHLTPDAFDQLIALATHRRKLEIERALVEVFTVDGWGAPAAPTDAKGHVPDAAPAGQFPGAQLAPGQVAAAARAPAPGVPASGAPTPAGPRPHTLRVELTPTLQDKLRHAQALLAHAVPSGDPAEVLERALDALIAQVERRKFGWTARPRDRVAVRPAAPRTVPARVRRAVAARDGDRCAFVASDGHRCSSRRKLEFDHVQPFARGGQSTAEGMRLLCRAHNRHEAERIFGRQFMLRRQEECVQERGDPARALALGQESIAESIRDSNSSQDELRE